MQRVARREAAAERELVVRVLQRVRKKANLLLRSGDVDDATQVAMLEILRSAHGFAGHGSLEGWCERIAIRSIVRMRRRDHQHDARIDPRAVPDDHPAPADSLVRRDVERFLAELSDERYAAIVLRYVEGCSIDEIADTMQVSRNTVKDRLRCALEELRKLARRSEVIALVRRSPP